MQTWLLNSKKCSTVKRLSLAAFSVFVVLSPALAAQAPLSARDLQAQLKAQIQNRKSAKFELLLAQWEKKFNSNAALPLMTLAQDRSLPDADRYIALMGGAKLGGLGTSTPLTSLANDSSWMIRSGALRALAAMKSPSLEPTILKLLKDPALVVRLEAVSHAGRNIKSPEIRNALTQALIDPANYHKGRAQWIPQHALKWLAASGDTRLISKIKPLLEHKSDPALQKLAIKTLESLTGRILKKNGTLNDQLRAWKAFSS